MSIVEVENLSIERSGVRILSELNFMLSSSDVVGISGPNGSGKTTLIRAIATLTAPTEGSVSLFGGVDTINARKRIGLIGHRPYLVPQLTLSENLHHVARLGGYSPDRVDHAIDVVGLGAAGDRRASDASFGMLRRIEIAQQLVAKPDLLLLDEAVSGLDDSAQELISELIRLTTGRGGATAVVSHDRNYLDKSCQIVLQLDGGRLRQS